MQREMGGGDGAEKKWRGKREEVSVGERLSRLVYTVFHPHSLELSCVGNWSHYLGLSSNKLDNRELFKPGTALQVAKISPNATFS